MDAGSLFAHARGMTKLGSNVRCVAAHEHREAIASLFTEALGATVMHPTSDLDVYVLEGSRVGVYFVAAERALTPAQHQTAGTWLELVVADVAATRDELVRRGLTPLDYPDREHVYFQVPGGQVFRLASV
jgi:hypothetical protein